MSERGNEFELWPGRFLEPEREEPALTAPPKLDLQGHRRQRRAKLKRKRNAIKAFLRRTERRDDE